MGTIYYHHDYSSWVPVVCSSGQFRFYRGDTLSGCLASFPLPPAPTKQATCHSTSTAPESSSISEGESFPILSFMYTSLSGEGLLHVPPIGEICQVATEWRTFSTVPPPPHLWTDSIIVSCAPSCKVGIF